MFKPKQLPLKGEEYLLRFRNLPREARASMEWLRRMYHALRPAVWLDQLTKEQLDFYYFVTTQEGWGRIKNFLIKDVREVPLISLSISMQEGQTRPTFLTVTTYTGHTATLSMLALAHNTQGWFKEEDLVPEDLLKWMRDPEIYVIVSGLTEFFREPLPAYQATSIVDTEQVFGFYQSIGVIRPNIVPRVGDIAYQMCFSFAYHHLPCSQETFRSMVGESSYEAWPPSRQVGWRPHTTHGDLEPAEAFFHFYQAVGPLAFLYRLIQHGIIYDGMQAVQKELHMRELLLVFLRGNVQDVAARQQTDPLALQRDEPEQTEVVLVPEAQSIPKYTPEEVNAISLQSYSPTPVESRKDVSAQRRLSPHANPEEATTTTEDDYVTIYDQDENLEEWSGPYKNTSPQKEESRQK